MQKIEIKYMSITKKKTITQDNIYVVRKFTCIHRVTVILLFSRKKNTKYDNTIFFFTQINKPNPNLKNNSAFILQSGFTMG